MPAAKDNKYHQKGDEPMTAHLHCRITPKMKARFVEQAMVENKKLCEWVMQQLEKGLR